MISHDRDGFSPAQIARINRLGLARYRKPLTEAEQIARGAKVLRYGLAIICVCWVIGLLAMIYVGENTLWATEETKAGFPTLELRP